MLDRLVRISKGWEVVSKNPCVLMAPVGKITDTIYKKSYYESILADPIWINNRHKKLRRDKCISKCIWLLYKHNYLDAKPKIRRPWKWKAPVPQNRAYIGITMFT